VTLRSRLTLLFLAAVEVTFLSAVGAYWGLQSWRLVTDDLTVVHEQHRRLTAVLDHLATRQGLVAGQVATAVDDLRHHVQTLDESERVAALAKAVHAGSRPGIRRTVRRLGRYYEREHRRLRARGAFLARVSNALLVGIVGVVIASFLAFLWAIRAWLVEPIRMIQRATEVMSTGDLAHRIPVAGNDELGRLAGSINRMAASLAHIQTQLVTSERFALLGELAAYVAHNIRNPLASIRATAQAEMIHLPATDPRRMAFDDIVTASDRLGAWVTDLLRSVSPIALERRPGSVGELVTRCAELARPRLDAAGVELVLAVAETPAVSFDQAKLEQVVSAVLANASDAAPRGSRIVVDVEHEGQTVALRIADQGPGIPAARRSRLFTPFATSKPSGTGLGLWLSQKIVVAHGGTIALLDGERGGTTVEMRLPTVREP
jgi:signal transduction histidine kinase